MDVRLRLAELQKSRKRHLPINDTSDLCEQQQETNSEHDDEENVETNFIKFEQGVTQKGAVSIWHAGYRYIKNRGKNWRCSNKDCPAKARAEEKDGQFVGTLGEKEHNHPPTIQKKVCEEIRSKMKRDNHPILGELRANVPDEVYIGLGSDDALKKLLHRFIYN
uniref:FLYWCH-type domain-containing protein n=1 Tax=Meloidogyne hapla TaxID=6305 RepID=A0A1I8BTN6_MELHA